MSAGIKSYHTYRDPLQMFNIDLSYCSVVSYRRDKYFWFFLCFHHCPLVHSISPVQNFLRWHGIWNIAVLLMLLKKGEASLSFSDLQIVVLCIYEHCSLQGWLLWAVPPLYPSAFVILSFIMVRVTHGDQWGCAVNKCQNKWNNYFMWCTYENTT